MNQNKVIKNSGIVIPKKVGESQISYIKEFLTRTVPSYQNSPAVTLKFYLENESGDIKVPRYFPVDKFIDNVCIEDITKTGQPIDIKHHITLRDDLQKNIVDYMINNRNGIIQANPGSGKTIVTIFVICKLQMKTIILVHRDSLMQQWEDRFLECTDINKAQIGRLSSSNFKDCLNKSIVISTNQTFVSLLKRYRNEFLQELKNANFGILVSDEAHTTVGAPTFSECSLHIPAERTYGLSATPSRQDGTSDVMEYHLGPVHIPVGKSSTMEARVTVILIDFKLSSSKSRPYIYWGGYFQRSRYLSLMKKSKPLMDLCNSLLDKFSKDDRNILLVGERIKLLELLFDNVKNLNKGMFVGSAKLDKIEDQITFTTPGKSRDGVDFVLKDCLILTSPIGNIEQMVGRILRIKDNKKHPILIDIVDIGESNMSRSLNQRLNYYKSKDWEVKFIHIDNTLKNITEEEAQDIIFSD
jgi:hypothetical protein